METIAERQTQWARLIIDSLVRCGVREAIISPGSRSTPFVIAALEHHDLRCTSALDERSAAHFALGQARSTLVPSLVLCTSGSAPANYFPAVVEASEAGVPLVVLSADRPPELLHCGANQATDQVAMFGSHVRFFANLGEPSLEPRGLRAVRRLVARAVADATGHKPGPVHLNAHARKPLEPAEPSAALRSTVDAVLNAPPTRVLRRRPVDPTPIESIPRVVIDQVAKALDRASKPVILCGPGDRRNGMFADAVQLLCDRAGALLLAEATSQLRFSAQTHPLGAFDAIWRTELGRLRLVPDFVLQLGAVPISKGWEQLVEDHSIERIVVHPWQWADPSSDAAAIVQTDVGSLVTALAAAQFHPGRRDSSFSDFFRRAEETTWRIASEILEQSGDVLTEPAAVRAVVDIAPDPSALVLGNSLPIRDVETWVRPNGKPLVVYAQRGVSGIDGVVSGAAGVASAVHGATTLLVGDLSFLHDLNGLQLAAGVEGPLVVVVIHNGGGRIFELLPIANRTDAPWLSYFTTPHDADLQSAARVYGCTHRRVTTRSALREALADAYASKGCTVVEAVVPPLSARDQGRELVARLERALFRENR